MPSKRRPEARRRKQPRATKIKSTVTHIPRHREGSVSSDRAFSDRAFEAKNRAFHALTRMRRDGLSLGAAAREEGTTPITIRKYLPAVLRRSNTGRWIATKSDHYVRHITLPGPYGPIIVRARESREAQLASAYLNAVAKWARTGKTNALASFHGKKVGGFELVTAGRTLEPLRDAGLIQLDSLYAALKDTL